MSKDKFEAICDVGGCLHCWISRSIVETGQPITYANICQIGQVIADMIASIEPEELRQTDGADVKREINKMIDAAISGRWPPN